MSTKKEIQMQRDQSADGLCRQGVSDLKEEPEKIFCFQLVYPIMAITGYVYWLKLQYEEFKKQEDTHYLYANASWSVPIFFTIVYLLVIHFGKEEMQKRSEFKIKPYIFAYNCYQCILNLWGVIAMYMEVYQNPIFTGLWGNTHYQGKQSFWIGFLVWVHYNNKYVELLDTLWMVLRKKNKQISFLHCYHHVLLIWSWFLVCKIDTAGDVYFGASVNSFIHVIMYGYYSMTLLDIPCPWKKMITTAQMCQFSLVACHSMYAFYAGKVSPILAAHQLFVMLNMLVLFSQFFYTTYGKKNSASKSSVDGIKKKQENKKD